MCLFVAVGVAASVDEVRSAFGALLEVRAVANPHIAATFPRGASAFWITHKGCSCDLQPYRREADPAAMRRRLEKKGWSKNKVERAVAQSTGAGPTPLETEPIEGFRGGLRELARGHDVVIFGHWFHGNEDEDWVGELPALQAMEPSALTNGPLPKLEEAFLKVSRLP